MIVLLVDLHRFLREQLSLFILLSVRNLLSDASTAELLSH